MQDGQPSRTAMHSALFRAAHTLRGVPPLVFCDPYAAGLAGHDSDASALAAIEAHPQSGSAGFVWQFAVRSRHAEDALLEAMARGVGQYVLLGAGLDSFGVRRRDLAGRLAVFEVDHPATQGWKRRRLAELGLAVPPHVHFVTVDFERQSLPEALRDGGFSPEVAAFFSWIGVTVYLPKEVIRRTLALVASLAGPGGGIVLTYIRPPDALPEGDAARVRQSVAVNARLGEPWISFFEPPEMDDCLRAAGFDEVRHLDAAGAHARYLAGRRDAAPLQASFAMAVARRG